MTDRDFLAEILAHPDDDGPRLIYADWLEEQGNPRGEFIRVQCELAALTKPEMRGGPMYGSTSYGQVKRYVRDPRDVPRYSKLLSRQVELLNRHAASWCAPLSPHATGVLFDRGCVEGLKTAAENFVAHAPQWYLMYPLRQLRLAAVSDWAAFLRCPLLTHLQTLDLGWMLGVLRDHEIELVAQCPHLTNLRRLDFGFMSTLTERGARALLESPHLAKLQAIGGPFQIRDAELREAFQTRFNLGT